MQGLDSTPSYNHQFCLLEEVDEEWGKEETYPKASYLTLTGVTKGPKKRGKDKEIEMEEERGNER